MKLNKMHNRMPKQNKQEPTDNPVMALVEAHGMKLAKTLAELLEVPPEFDERLASKKWRLNNFYFIKDENANVLKFHPKPTQDHFFLHRWFREIILKARQLGFSTAIVLDILDDCLFNKNFNAAIVADKLENAKKIFEKIEFAWGLFPQSVKDYLGLRAVSDSSTSIEFTNGSKIVVGVTLHAGTYQRVHISEYGPLCAGSPDKAEELMKSVIPTVSANGRITIESTAEGEGNDFHMKCVEAEARSFKEATLPLHPLEYRFFFYPWFEDDKYETDPTGVDIPDHVTRYFDDLSAKLGREFNERKRAWYTLQERALKSRMREQYPSTPDEAFLASGDRLFDPEIVKVKLQKEVCVPHETRLEGRLIIYKPFVAKHRYGIAGDPSQGIGRDSASAQVIDFTTNEQVATYEDPNVSPTAFGDILQYIGFLYGGAIIAPEANNHGHATIARLVELGYPNLYQFVVKGVLDEHPTTRIGWLTTQTTKPRMFYELSEAFSDPHEPLIVHDEATLTEALYYRKEETNIISPLSQKKLSRHFDRLTALAIAFQLRSEATVGNVDDPRLTKHIKSRRERSRTMR